MMNLREEQGLEGANMAFTAITVADDMGFNDWADGVSSTAASTSPAVSEMHQATIIGLGALAAGRAAFDQPVELPPSGSFMAGVNRAISNFPQEFADLTKIESPWGQPVAAAPQSAPSLLDSIGKLADAGFNAMTNTAPAAEQGIEMGDMFGKLSGTAEPGLDAQPQQLTAFQRRNYNSGNKLS